MHFKTGDKVVVISGKDKGKEGKIIKVLRNENRVVVEGVNIVKNEMEAPIHASNVMILDPKTKKPTRIGHSINKDGKKIRVTKKSNSSLD